MERYLNSAAKEPAEPTRRLRDANFQDLVASPDLLELLTAGGAQSGPERSGLAYFDGICWTLNEYQEVPRKSADCSAQRLASYEANAVGPAAATVPLLAPKRQAALLLAAVELQRLEEAEELLDLVQTPLAAEVLQEHMAVLLSRGRYELAQAVSDRLGPACGAAQHDQALERIRSGAPGCVSEAEFGRYLAEGLRVPGVRCPTAVIDPACCFAEDIGALLMLEYQGRQYVRMEAATVDPGHPGVLRRFTAEVQAAFGDDNPCIIPLGGAIIKYDGEVVESILHKSGAFGECDKERALTLIQEQYPDLKPLRLLYFDPFSKVMAELLRQAV